MVLKLVPFVSSDQRAAMVDSTAPNPHIGASESTHSRSADRIGSLAGRGDKKQLCLTRHVPGIRSPGGKRNRLSVDRVRPAVAGGAGGGVLSAKA